VKSTIPIVKIVFETIAEIVVRNSVYNTNISESGTSRYAMASIKTKYAVGDQSGCFDVRIVKYVTDRVFDRQKVESRCILKYGYSRACLVGI
jgi:hypothetical protein